MSEEDSAQNKGTEAPASGANTQAPEVVRSVETAQPATQQQLDKVEREMNAFERSTLKWTRITCAVFAVTLIVIGLQWIAMRGQLGVMNGQLAEMKSGGADTKEMVRATKDLALAAKTQSDNTAHIATASGKQADAAKALAELTAKQFARTQRAYLVARAPEPVLPPLPVFRIPIENYGHVMATGISIHINYMRYKPPTLQNRQITSLDSRTTDYQEGQPIYPGERRYYITVMIPQLSKDEITSVMTGSQNLLVRARIKYNTGFGGSETLTICADYQAIQAKWEGCGGQGATADSGTSFDMGEARRN